MKLTIFSRKIFAKRLIIHIYDSVMILLIPIWKIVFLLRIKSGKENKERIKERFGIYKIPRPPGKVIWFHGASIGESRSALCIIQKIIDKGIKVNCLEIHKGWTEVHSFQDYKNVASLIK